MSGTDGTPNGWPSEPTNPRGGPPGGRPSGPPPSPPPYQAPTALPPQSPPGSGWPVAPPPGPQPQPGAYGGGSYGGPPPAGPGSYGQPPKRRRGRLFLVLGLGLLLVIGLGVTGWLYFTGRFGVGPLSAADKDAAATISDEVGAPEWADKDQIECAVDDLVHEHRSGGLAERGLIERDGDSWKYTGEWRSADATAYFESVLECSDDWAAQVGEMWNIDDTGCLGDIDASTVGAWFAQKELTISEDEDSAEKDATEAVEALDKCYLKEPAAPEATPKAAYRAVEFTFAEAAEVEAGEVAINTGGEGSWTPISGPSVEVDTEEGGARGCVEAQAVTTYGWGSTATSETSICGTAKPKRIWWKKAPCTQQPGCYGFQLHYEGFRDFASITARYTSNGGSCMATSGSCSDTVTALPGGRGTVVTWTFPGSYRGNFVARVGSLKAKIPN